MKLFLQASTLALVWVLSSCGTTKQIPEPPAGEITYKIITRTSFAHLDAAYFGSQSALVRHSDIQKHEVVYPIGKIQHGFISSISCTGYGAVGGDGSIELQILHNGHLVKHDIAEGENPSLAISYTVE